jgi:hypothetical protein
MPDQFPCTASSPLTSRIGGEPRWPCQWDLNHLARLRDREPNGLPERSGREAFNVTSDAYALAEFAEPDDQAAEDEAERLQGIASDELDAAALPLILARASTIAGLIAKAGALKFAFPENDRIIIEDAIRDDGIFDAEPVSFSLARDLLAIAWKTEAA